MPIENTSAAVDTVTFSGNGSAAAGSVASRLLQSNFDVMALRPCTDAGPQSMRANATLRKDEWIQYDTAIVDVARKRLQGVADLLNAGLRYPIANALGVTRVEWETQSDMDGAELTMSGISPARNDRVEFNLVGLPLPIVHKDFNLNIRALESSRRSGMPLDTTQAQVAARKVVEFIETMLFAGSTALGANNTIYGYTTATYRNTGSVTASWATTTGENILKDVIRMMSALCADNMFGPYMIYVPVDVFNHLQEDFKAGSDKSIYSRIKEVPGIIDIKPTAELSAPHVLMVQMTSDVVDMLDGIQPTSVQWDSHGGFVMHFKVLSIMIPRIRNDSLNQSGIAHYS